jgi:DNA-binding FadR family transcriptional regulator
VRVSHGGATRVLDWRATGGLDLLAQLGHAAGPVPELVRSALEMRLSIGADAARRCAERAPAALIAEIEALAWAQPANDAEAAENYERLWDLVVRGSDNLAYRLALNSLISVGGGFDLRTRSLPEARDRDAVTALAAAIAAGDSDAAEATARDLLERTPCSS